MSVACRSTCWPTLSRYIDRDVSVNISVEILADMSVNMSTDRSRSTHRLRVGRYVDRNIGQYVDRHIGQYVDRHIGRYIDRYVGQHVDQHIGRGVCKLHMGGIQRLTYFNKRCWNLRKCFCSTCGAINIYYWSSARPRWQDIGQVLFLCFYGLRQSATSFPGSLISPPFAI